MQSMNEIVTGMTPQEKQIYFAHMSMRAKEEEEYMQVRIEERKAYKKRLIADVMKYRPGEFTEEELKNKSVRALECILDY